MVARGAPANRSSARSSASCPDWPLGWVCQPQSAAPSYCSPSASLPTERKRAATTLRAGPLMVVDGTLGFDLLEQLDRVLTLLARAVTHHFLEQLACAILDAEIDV